MTAILKLKARAKEIFKEEYHYPSVPFRSLGRACFASAMQRARWEAIHGTDAERAARDAEAIAAHFGFDIERLQFERDRLFWGNSTTRHSDLPRYERALKLAQDHEIKIAKAA